MEYLELGEIFKINVNDKTVCLKVEPDGSQDGCDNCYFYNNDRTCSQPACSHLERNDNANIIYKQINPIEDIYVVFGKGSYGCVKQCSAYPNEEDARKEVEALNRDSFNYTYYYDKTQYYPYGIVDDIKEVVIN